MKQTEIQQLVQISKQLRKDVVQSLATAGFGYLCGSLGLADVFAVLYNNVLNRRPHEQMWSNRDRLIFSIGHVAPIPYASLEYQVNGGFGSGAFAKVLAKNHPVPREIISMPNCFGESGTPSELLQRYGLNADNITGKVSDVNKRKRM